MNEIETVQVPSGFINFICDQCHHEFEAYPAHRKSTVKFCSTKCYSNYRKRDTRIKQGRLVVQFPGHHRANQSGYVFNYILVAEKALGKPLPSKVAIHHVGSLDDDKLIVICENNAYHLILHARKRIVEAGGNPNTQKICSKCKNVKDRILFNHTTQGDGRSNYCKECERLWKQERREQNGSNRASKI